METSIKKKIFITASVTIVILIIAVFTACSQGNGQKREEWVEAAENYTGVLLYDKGSVRRDGYGEVTFRTKHIFSPEMCRTLAEASEGFIQASHYVSLDKVNCRKWEYEQMEIVFKDFYGKKIEWPGSKKDSSGQTGYRPIPPNTLMEFLAREVCNIAGPE